MIKLRSLYLEPFSKEKHYGLVNRLNDDQAVYDYISKHFEDWVEEPESDSKYEVGKSYVIKDDNEILGMCGSTRYENNGIIDLWCGIDKKSRGQGVGEKLLVQITDYFLDNIPDLKNVKLVIKKNNVASNKVAINSGYSLTDQYKDNNVYHYFK